MCVSCFCCCCCLLLLLAAVVGVSASRIRLRWFFGVRLFTLCCLARTAPRTTPDFCQGGASCACALQMVSLSYAAAMARNLVASLLPLVFPCAILLNKTTFTPARNPKCTSIRGICGRLSRLGCLARTAWCSCQFINANKFGPKFRAWPGYRRRRSRKLVRTAIAVMGSAVGRGGSAHFEWPCRCFGWQQGAVKRMVSSWSMYLLNSIGVPLGLWFR